MYKALFINIMELKNFIKKTISEITQGVLESQNELSNTGVIINPSKANNGYINETTGKRAIQNISFDIGITTQDKDGEKGGIGVLTGIFSIGTTQTTEQSSDSISKIKFDIPISLPIKDNLKNKSSFGISVKV